MKVVSKRKSCIKCLPLSVALLTTVLLTLVYALWLWSYENVSLRNDVTRLRHDLAQERATHGSTQKRHESNMASLNFHEKQLEETRGKLTEKVNIINELNREIRGLREKLESERVRSKAESSFMKTSIANATDVIGKNGKQITELQKQVKFFQNQSANFKQRIVVLEAELSRCGMSIKNSSSEGAGKDNKSLYNCTRLQTECQNTKKLLEDKLNTYKGLAEADCDQRIQQLKQQPVEEEERNLRPDTAVQKPQPNVPADEHLEPNKSSEDQLKKSGEEPVPVLNNKPIVENAKNEGNLKPPPVGLSRDRQPPMDRGPGPGKVRTDRSNVQLEQRSVRHHQQQAEVQQPLVVGQQQQGIVAGGQGQMVKRKEPVESQPKIDVPQQIEPPNVAVGKRNDNSAPKADEETANKLELDAEDEKKEEEDDNNADEGAIANEENENGVDDKQMKGASQQKDDKAEDVQSVVKSNQGPNRT